MAVYTRFTVSMGAFAQLPVNENLSFAAALLLVSMGAFAQLPVNALCAHIKRGATVSMGAFAQLPVNSSYEHVYTPKFQWAPLPNSLSTACAYSQLTGWFQWAPLPNSLSTLKETYEQYTKVSMGAFAQLPVNMMLIFKGTAHLFQWAPLPNSLSTLVVSSFV